MANVKSSGNLGLVSGFKSRQQIEYSQYKYFLDEDVIYVGKDGKATYINKELISEILIERDFEYDTMPFIILKGGVQDLTAVKIAMGLPEGTIHLKITKGLPNSSISNIESYQSNRSADDQYINKKKCIDEKFQIFMDDQSIKMYEKFANHKMSTSYSSDELREKNQHNNEEPFVLALIKKEHLVAPKKIINAVIPAGTSIATMIGYGMKTAGMKKVLMSQPDNTEGNQKTILVPPMNLLDYFDFIDQTRGIYDTRYRFFQDFDRTYFLDSSGKCNAYERKEPKIVNIFINSYGQEGSKTYGMAVTKKTSNTGESFSKGEEIAINVPQNNVDIKTNSAFDKELKFSSILSAGFRSNDLEDSKINGVPGYDNTIIKNNVYANKHVLKAEAHAVKESACVLRINLLDTDLDVITPNKEYKVSFGDSTYGEMDGTYRLIKITTVLERNSTEFTMYGVCELRKIG